MSIEVREAVTAAEQDAIYRLRYRVYISAVNNVIGPGATPLPTFGRPVIAFPARQIQLGARLTF